MYQIPAKRLTMFNLSSPIAILPTDSKNLSVIDLGPRKGYPDAVTKECSELGTKVYTKTGYIFRVKDLTVDRVFGIDL
jgi:hypothetical protein